MCKISVSGAVDEEQGIRNDGIKSSRSHRAWNSLYSLIAEKKRANFPDFEIRFAAVPRDRRNANANREDQAQRTQ
jgi:hypothetical protein